MKPLNRGVAPVPPSAAWYQHSTAGGGHSVARVRVISRRINRQKYRFAGPYALEIKLASPHGSAPCRHIPVRSASVVVDRFSACAMGAPLLDTPKQPRRLCCNSQYVSPALIRACLT